MYSVRDGRIYSDNKEIGHVGEILVDTRQSEVDRDTEIVSPARLQTLPYGDYLFVTPTGQIVVLEEKKQGDLDTSWRQRRLQRQLRLALEHNEEGITGLALRLHGPLAIFAEQAGTFYFQWDELLIDLAKLQALGIPVVFLPSRRVISHLVKLRAALQPGIALLSALAGDDRGRVREKMKPAEMALRQAVDGVGKTLAVKWAEAADQDLVVALSMTDKEMKAVGLPINVRNRVGVLREGS
jgi:hypothetical protein